MSDDELRPVTALFADIVGSTSLGERLTPDEVKALIGECVSRMSRSVEEFGGTIQAYTGDGICAYFGVPVAHEDDTERAARAGLRIISVASEYARDAESAWGVTGFNVRVGINTGQTGVGLVGSAAPQAVALGDTTNVAARLQAAADPGTIVVGSETARQLAPLFAVEPLGDVQVKGRTGAVSAWRLVGPLPGGARGPSAPLIGREGEMARLGARLDELRAGRGQIVLVIGDAGIGKSRLLAEFRSAASGATWLQGSCVSYGGESAAGPFVDMVRSWLGLEQGEPEVVVRMRLRSSLGTLLGTKIPEVLPGLARLLAVRLDPDQGSAPSKEAHDSIALTDSIRSWVGALTAQGPVVLAVDGLHWADASTLDVAESLIDLTDRSALMFVAAFRPDYSSPAWRFRMKVLSDYPHRTEEVHLGPLGNDAATQIAELLLPPEVDGFTKEGLVRRTEGNPLFLEELARSLAERGPSDRSKTWSLSIRNLLPASLESLFVARIDRLPEDPRRLIQAAAVIGRTFSVPVLERVVGSDRVDADLAQLLRADLIREVRRYPVLECTFRHGLIQEAALETLTAERLRELNGRVAIACEALYADSVDEHVEEIAYHYYRSDDQGKALLYLERGAEQAQARGAQAEANELLLRAAKVAERIEDDQAATRIAARLAELEPN
jgi:class 3 adenylate cyclase/predicted ATPase